MSYKLENFAALDRLQQRFWKIANPDMVPLMVSWVEIIRKDNRDGILAGLDRYGRPMRPVKYRPDPKALINIKSKAASAMRHGQRPNTLRNLVFAGFGPHQAGLHNNLTSREYRGLSGPPLAPRGQFSRVISNFKVGYFEEGNGRASVMAIWDDVVNAKGRRFLGYHFTGTAKLPQRDIRGIRATGIFNIRKATRAWMLDIVRTYGG